MSDVKTIVIKIGNDEKKMSKEHLVYEPVELSATDPIIRSLLDDTVGEFGENPEKITITCKLVVQ